MLSEKANLQNKALVMDGRTKTALTLHPLRFREKGVYICSQNERQKMSHKSIVGMKDKRYRNPLKDPTTLGTFRTLFVNFSQKKPSSASLKDDKDDKFVLFGVRRLQDLNLVNPSHCLLLPESFCY